MKVNTDGVLLGAAMTIRPDDRCLLDIGTGTGTIALMAAQRLADMSSCNDCNKGVPSVSERSITINAIDIRYSASISSSAMAKRVSGVSFAPLSRIW